MANASVATSNGSLMVLIMAPSVQAELELTEAQKIRAEDFARDASEKTRELSQAMRQPGVSAQALMAASASLRDENEQALGQILDSGQKRRFDEISLQVEGPLAIARPEVARKLNLTSAQSQRVQTVMSQFQQAQRQLMFAMRSGEGEAAGRLTTGSLAQGEQRATQLRVTAAQQMGRVLNAQQKEAFNKLLGKPFEIKTIDPDLARAGGGFPASTSAASSSDEPAPQADRKSSKASRRSKSKSRRQPEPSP
jgi:hypothetical protein